MYLDKILAAQKQGKAFGIPAICSAHPYVLRQTIKEFDFPLIEATCNQVNQYGGYTGMTPIDFVQYVRRIADEFHFPFSNMVLGGDHLGPNLWQHESAEVAMQRSEVLIRDYVQAGFTKIHLDCSMKLADDPAGALNLEVLAQRAARLAKVAEAAAPAGALRYVIGSEVPVPGGAMEHEEGVGLTQVHDAQMTIDIMCDAFLKAGLHSAWERVLALVVQPGVEFGDDFVLPYQPVAARELSRYIESQSVVFEAHSTDYQSRDALRNMVQDHFAILKVGPALTFAFREAVFALAQIEHELLPAEERSNLVDVVEAVMLAHPAYWKKYYRGNEQQITLQRKYSLSDRIRYYWNDSRVQAALDRLQQNLTEYPIPLSLLSQFLPQQYAKVRRAELRNDPQSLILDHIQQVLDEYAFACGSSQRQ